MEMRLLHAPVRADLVAAAYARAEADGVTLADVVTAALEAHLETTTGGVQQPRRRTPARTKRGNRASTTP
ncbi:hypothetical protein [Kribbella shirazensis]|uniref:Uncharacterized protein n=1 Tax=Kribbella shirazensis TaxID=1105143 RepID=A0A7X6A1E8_9ACTN|nr:hypothetical protein [Kribbella shirazensis]NIK57903.1 hypothetical protein [Kribbella shirazensis]